MEIKLGQLGKRFGYRWIFKDINYRFSGNSIYGIRGNNGTGKSTLLKIIAGLLSPSKGEIAYQQSGKKVPRNKLYQHLAMAAPYFDLLEELSLKDFFSFYLKSSPNDDAQMLTTWIERSELKMHQHKLLKHYSSGMKQRVKLCAALMSQRSLVLLDEPSTNLDTNSIDWFHELMKDYGKDKTILLASNEQSDFSQITNFIDIGDYIPKEKL